MQIHILGTGTSQGIPVIGCQCPVCRSHDPRDKRLRCSILLEKGDTAVLIDVGPDFRHQMLRAGRNDVDAILLTHEHNDHINGLDDVRPINFRWKKHIPLYLDERVKKQVLTRFAYIFDDRYDYPGKPRLDLRPLNENPVTIGQMEIIPVRIMHGSLRIWGFRIDTFCYITDAKSIPEGELEKLQNLDFLIINALHHRQHSAHLNLNEALHYIKLINPKQALLTHISHYMGLHADLAKNLPSNIAPAFDGQVITC